MTMPELRGRLAMLRPFSEADIDEAYLGWLNDPHVVRFSNQRFVRHDRESSLRYLASFAGTENLFVSVRALDDGRRIGTMTAYRAKRHGTADVGILIGDTGVWGRGYGQDAWDTFTRWLLGPGGVRKLTAGTLACNVGMVRIIERAGMQREAVRRAQEIVDGHAEDVVYYARFRDG